MKVVFLLSRVQEERGAFHSTLRKAAALGADHEVELWVVKDRGKTAGWIPPDVTVRCLTNPAGDVADDVEVPTSVSTRDLAAQPSRLVPLEWERPFSGLTDAVLESELGCLRADVVVSTSPGTLAAAVTWTPRDTAVVHQERFRAPQRAHSLAALTAFGSRVEAVVVGDDVTAAHLRGALAAGGPRVVTIADPLPDGFVPQARPDSRVIVAAGALAQEQHFFHLVKAFGRVADRMPDWRLRIFGEGRMQHDLASAARKALLYDRVELPGISTDMRSEWARAGMAVVTARSGVPMVVAEAMAAGLPVIGHNNPDGCPQLIEHDRNGLLTHHGSTRTLAAAMLRLADDPDLRCRLGAAARESVQGLRPETIAAQWEDLFAETVAPDAPVAAAVAAAAAEPARAPAVATPVEVDVAPAAARRRTLALLARTADSVTDDWFVLRELRHRPPVVVVPQPVRRAFLSRLAEDDDLHLEVTAVGSDSELRSPRGRLERISETLTHTQPSVLTVSLPRTHAGRRTLASVGGQVDVEFWDAADDDVLLPPRENEWVGCLTRGAKTVEADVCGLQVPVPPLTSEPTLHDVTVPIDAVYTWVDGDDPVWQAKRDQRLDQTTGLSLTRASSGRARFVSRDELRYSMRSLHLFAPWLNHIYLVTDGQVPPWLDPDHPGVTLVSHDEILPAEHLPTFNSHAIETALHRVPGLSDQFIYFNDDVLLGRPVHPDQFFNVAGQFAAFIGEKVLGEDLPDVLPFHRAGLNNRALLQRDFGRIITRVMRHTPHPFTRQTVADLERRYAEEFARTVASPFRSESDVSVASSLGQHFGLLTGAAYTAHLKAVYVSITEATVESVLSKLLHERAQDVICIADHHEWAVPEGRVNVLMREFFEAYYPVEAPWERSD
jgi:glycosyltransferase involved in cell wall biosynthesis